MTDDQANTPADDLLIQAARDYNVPGRIPRDEMWSAIAASRAAGRSAPTSEISGSRGRGIPRPWIWPATGIAAAALIAVGIVIGRNADISRQTPPVSHISRNATPTRPEPHPDSALVNALHDETRNTDAEVRRLAQKPAGSSRSDIRHPASVIPDLPSQVSRPDSRELAYRLVVLRHLAGSEALITSFRLTSRRGEVDPQTAAWARELLGTTRLLENSPAAADPVMKRLLDDLDLVIAQIAQYASRGTYDPEELDLIEQSIKRRGVMTKLRSTPAPTAARM